LIEEGEDFFLGYVFSVSISELITESVKDKLIVPYSAFFWNFLFGNSKRNQWL
jgi:hypothetical protein